jgi:hypothetical protein
MDDGYKQLERKTDTAALRWRSSGMPNAEGTMVDAFVQQLMLEKKRDSVKMKIKSTSNINKKKCHNSRFTGARHELWYGKAKPCCMCGHHEGWRHVLSCKSLDTELTRKYSWVKLKKLKNQMDKWRLQSDMWITMKNRVRRYTMNPLHQCPTWVGHYVYLLKQDKCNHSKAPHPHPHPHPHPDRCPREWKLPQVVGTTVGS